MQRDAKKTHISKTPRICHFIRGFSFFGAHLALHTICAYISLKIYESVRQQHQIQNEFIFVRCDHLRHGLWPLKWHMLRRLTNNPRQKPMTVNRRRKKLHKSWLTTILRYYYVVLQFIGPQVKTEPTRKIKKNL